VVVPAPSTAPAVCGVCLAGQLGSWEGGPGLPHSLRGALVTCVTVAWVALNVYHLPTRPHLMACARTATAPQFNRRVHPPVTQLGSQRGELHSLTTRSSSRGLPRRVLYVTVRVRRSPRTRLVVTLKGWILASPAVCLVVLGCASAPLHATLLASEASQRPNPKWRVGRGAIGLCWEVSAFLWVVHWCSPKPCAPSA
jgi:hypothetical protein